MVLPREVRDVGLRVVPRVVGDRHDVHVVEGEPVEPVERGLSAANELEAVVLDADLFAQVELD